MFGATNSAFLTQCPECGAKIVTMASGSEGRPGIKLICKNGHNTFIPNKKYLARLGRQEQEQKEAQQEVTKKVIEEAEDNFRPPDQELAKTCSQKAS